MVTMVPEDWALLTGFPTPPQGSTMVMMVTMVSILATDPKQFGPGPRRWGRNRYREIAWGF